MPPLRPAAFFWAVVPPWWDRPSIRRGAPAGTQTSRRPVPGRQAHVENEKQYEALKDEGMSKERAAKIRHGAG